VASLIDVSNTIAVDTQESSKNLGRDLSKRFHESSIITHLMPPKAAPSNHVSILQQSGVSKQTEQLMGRFGVSVQNSLKELSIIKDCGPLIVSFDIKS